MIEKHGAINEFIDQHFEEYLENIRNFLKVPSISSTGEGIKENAEMVLNYLRKMDAEANLVNFKAGQPAIFGKLQSKNTEAKTLIVYSFYDGFKTNFEEWTFSPYEAKIVDSEKINLPNHLGKVIVAQSAVNTKGPLSSFLLALKGIKDSTGDIPLNLIFAIEGEEQIGSVHMREFFNKYENEFKQANAVYLPGMRQNEAGHVPIWLGTKGILRFELIVKGGSWGGTLDRKALQAPHYRLVDAPFWRMVRALNTIINHKDEIIIEKFFENVRPPTPEERKLLEEVKETFDETRWKKSLNIAQFQRGLKGKELIEKFIMYPLFHVEGIVPETQGGLPMNVKAKGHIRLVPNLTLDEVKTKIRQHLDNHGFSEVETKFYGGSDWARTSVNKPIVQTILKSLDIYGVNYSVWPTAVWGSGYFVFNRPPLNLDVGTTGLGHGERAHRLDEYITVNGIKDNMKFVATLLFGYANNEN